MNCTPHFVTANSPYKKLRHRIKGKLTGLCNQNVRCPHKKVSYINCGKNIFIVESMNAASSFFIKTINCFAGKVKFRSPAVKMCFNRKSTVCKFWNHFLHHGPYAFIVAAVQINAGFVLLNIWQKSFYYCRKEFALSTGPTDRKKKADWAAVFAAFNSCLTIFFNITYKLMINIVSCKNNILFIHGA